MLLQDTGNKRGSMCSPVGVFETKFREVPSVSVVDPLQLPLKGAHPALLSYCRFRERVRALSWWSVCRELSRPFLDQKTDAKPVVGWNDCQLFSDGKGCEGCSLPRRGLGLGIGGKA